MDKVIKILKLIFLTIGILIGIALLGVIFFVYQGVKSGDLKSYVAKTAVETIVPETSFTPSQKEMLDTGDFTGLAEDLEENVTPEQIDCATQMVGMERAQELVITKDPTPQEILKLSKCL
ncbi:hypothetical protein HN803_08185 [candidate division WWE3 bacterium]|jgi:hypothetical protein|nr:hypothetical protein [candidate division WWE3 bacterium]MBT7350730.1 hypothetical protein [candidate division WWE3 bacterium]